MGLGKLYIIPSVIANNNNVIPEQVREVITYTDYFLVENLRTARRYISSLKLGLTIEELTFELLDKKTSDQQVEKIMKSVLQGKNAGLLSESGCPGVADPGSKAVSYAHQKGVEVIPLVGPSSIILALMASGFNGQQFAFQGYLPIDKKDLESKIMQLENESKKKNQSQIFIETPYRNNQLLKSILKVASAESQLCIARDISGDNELILSHKIKQWNHIDIDLHKIPTVFILYAGH